jgi:hypothetical protein
MCRNFLLERFVRKKMTRMNLLFIHLCVSDLLVIVVEIPVRLTNEVSSNVQTNFRKLR